MSVNELLSNQSGSDLRGDDDSETCFNEMKNQIREFLKKKWSFYADESSIQDSFDEESYSSDSDEFDNPYVVNPILKGIRL